MAKILFFGDSITALRKNCIVASELIAKRYPQHEVVNKGVGGNDTGLARARFMQDVIAERPQLVVFSFGCNDAAIDVYKEKTTPRLTIEEYLENLTYFIRQSRSIDAQLLFFTPPPMVMTENLKCYYGGEPYLSNGFNFMLDRFIAAARGLMAQENVTVADVNAAFRMATGSDEERLHSLLPDGMHPNSAGQKIIFDTICPAIDRMLA